MERQAHTPWRMPRAAMVAVPAMAPYSGAAQRLPGITRYAPNRFNFHIEKLSLHLLNVKPIGVAPRAHRTKEKVEA